MLDQWTSVERLPPLGEDELQIWRMDLPDETMPEQYLHLLQPDEQARAERFRKSSVRLQFVAARAGLRGLLGNCLGIAAREVPITVTDFGKPETTGLFFNVAHSGNSVLIALCRAHRVGIDVEHLSRDVDALEIARHSFSIEEQAALSSIADAQQLGRAFFRCWARKEAVIKADGRGLSLPLNTFTVPVRERAENVQVPLPEGTSYYLTDIDLSDDSAASFALSVPPCSVRKFLFPLAAMERKA